MKIKSPLTHIVIIIVGVEQNRTVRVIGILLSRLEVEFDIWGKQKF